MLKHRMPSGPAIRHRVPRNFRTLNLFHCAAFAGAVVLLWGAAAQADITIMPLGDSITHGYTVAGGYRTRLYSDLNNAGFSFTLVGSSTDNPTSVLSQAGQAHHEGHP